MLLVVVVKHYCSPQRVSQGELLCIPVGRAFNTNNQLAQEGSTETIVYDATRVALSRDSHNFSSK